MCRCLLFVQVGLFNTLGFVLHCIFAICHAPFPVGTGVEVQAYTRCNNRFGLCQIAVGLFKRLGCLCFLF